MPPADPGVPPIPRCCGGCRLAWFAALDGAVELDVLAEARQLAGQGWSPADVEFALRNYRDWLAGRIAAGVDLFIIGLSSAVTAGTGSGSWSW